MSKSKQLIRDKFRTKVFERAKYCCQKCGIKGEDRQKTASTGSVFLDSHHIINRTKFLNGGYVLENGIALCDDCHIKAEEYHSTGIAVPGYAPNDLYEIIGSSLEQALTADKN